MEVFKIIFTITSLFTLTFCEEQVWAIELGTPTDMMTTFASIDQILRTLSTGIDDRLGSTVTRDLLAKVEWKAIEYLSEMEKSKRRKNQIRPSVEMGPGAFKTEIITYPPNYFANRLKTLLKIKQKQEERDRDVNAPK